MPDSAEAVQAFAAVPLFADLKRRQLTQVAQAAKTVVHKPGQQVAAEGRMGLGFHIVSAGDATVRIGDRVRRTLYPGDYFGEISMIDGRPRSASVTAGDQGMTTYFLNRTQFLSLVDSDKDLARAIMVALCGRIRASESAL